DTDRIGLIGANGSGKSTLLKVLAGTDTPDEGQVTLRQGVRVEYAPQNPSYEPQHTVLEHLFASQTDLARVMAEYEDLCFEMENNPTPELQQRMAMAISKLDALQAWEYESRARGVLDRLGVRDFHARMGDLSGGYRKRVA